MKWTTIVIIIVHLSNISNLTVAKRKNSIDKYQKFSKQHGHQNPKQIITNFVKHKNNDPKPDFNVLLASPEELYRHALRMETNNENSAATSNSHFNVTQLHAPNLPIKGAVSVEHMMSLGVVYDLRDVCMSNNHPIEAPLQWLSFPVQKFTGWEPQTTVWISEWLKIGLAQYDLEVMQILASTKV